MVASTSRTPCPRCEAPALRWTHRKGERAGRLFCEICGYPSEQPESHLYFQCPLGHHHPFLVADVDVARRYFYAIRDLNMPFELSACPGCARLARRNASHAVARAPTDADMVLIRRWLGQAREWRAAHLRERLVELQGQVVALLREKARRVQRLRSSAAVPSAGRRWQRDNVGVPRALVIADSHAGELCEALLDDGYLAARCDQAADVEEYLEAGTPDLFVCYAASKREVAVLQSVRNNPCVIVLEGSDPVSELVDQLSRR